MSINDPTNEAADITLNPDFLEEVIGKDRDHFFSSTCRV